MAVSVAALLAAISTSPAALAGHRIDDNLGALLPPRLSTTGGAIEKATSERARARARAQARMRGHANGRVRAHARTHN